MGEDVWGLWPSIGLFVGAALVIALVGPRMTRVAGEIADRTKLGQAMMGAVFLGATTSLSGIVTSTTAAAGGHGQLAVSNALGGIAAQTVFLAVADLTHRKANLEHAAASAENLVVGALLMILFTLPLVGMAYPDVAVLGMHPVTPALVVAYAFGLRLLSRTSEMPMWYPRRTRETGARRLHDEREAGLSMRGLWVRFVLFAAPVAVAGWVITRSAVSISSHTGLSQSLMGVLFTAVATSLPELVTTISAVRIGALTLAVGDILGGNSFDTIFLAVSDAAYREGSIYAALGGAETFMLAVCMLLTGVILLGLLHREKHGVANIGMESMLSLAIYAGAMVVLFLS